MATNHDEKATFSDPKQSKDTLFIVRSPLEINELANAKIQYYGNRSKPCDTLAHSAPESTAERLAQKPTSGRASSPAGSPKSSTVAEHSAGTGEVKALEAAAAAYVAAIEESEAAEAKLKAAFKAHRAAFAAYLLAQ